MEQSMNHLSDADLDQIVGGLNVIRVFVLAGTSSAPGGTGTDSGSTATNSQIWLTSAS
jgi:hypothetical protein